MVYFLLAALICSPLLTPDEKMSGVDHSSARWIVTQPPTDDQSCRWRRLGKFVREERCHEVGQFYLNKKNAKTYKCVIQMEDEPALGE